MRETSSITRLSMVNQSPSAARAIAIAPGVTHKQDFTVCNPLARGEDYSNMVLAARHYLDNIHSVDRSEFTGTINVIENMLASLED